MSEAKSAAKLRVVKNRSLGRKMDMRTSNPQANSEYVLMPHWDIVDESGKVVSGGITDGYFKSDRPRFATKKAALEALARRRAAAPELLEALQNLLWYVGQLEAVVYTADDNGTHEEVAKARAAIKKALGDV